MGDRCVSVIVIADDDYNLGKLPESNADLLISLGDLYDSTIEKVQQLYSCSKVLAVRGNHDFPDPFPDTIDDLHAGIIEYKGITFGGFSGSWKYKSRGHYLYKQNEVRDILKDFPPVDVFVAHNSPRGIHQRDNDIHQGFDAFIEYIERTQPLYFLHGHQHFNAESMLGNTKIIGVYGETLLSIGYWNNAAQNSGVSLRR